jgi:hypothetical protein
VRVYSLALDASHYWMVRHTTIYVDGPASAVNILLPEAVWILLITHCYTLGY